ncbi:MAG: HU family DNA-binding protein [Bacteroidales bacterium]|nr:HU family DNA-binding protein [Bacteroidales bacterium]
MKEKLNLQEIVDLLSRETGATKKDTDLFLRTLFPLISDSLIKDKIVKVKGLGTFKLILVEKRESVNVNTKEKYEIPAHYKLSFIPDADLKELVNEPFSAFEPVEIDPDALNDGPIVEEKEIAEKDTNTITEEEKPTEPETEIPEERARAEKPEESQKEDKKEEESISRPAVSAETIQQPTPSKKNFKKKSETKKSRLNSIILFLAIGILAVGGYQWIHYTLEEKKAAEIAALKEAKRQKRMRPPELLSTAKEILTETDSVIVQEKAVVDTEQQLKTVKEVSTETKAVQPKEMKIIDKVIMEKGNRLTLLAEKYYGHKIFWVYLYEANKSRIKNPNNVVVGTLIEIPAPEVYGIDINSGESVRKASALSAQIIETFN